MPPYCKIDYIATLQRMIARIETIIEEVNNSNGDAPETVCILQVVDRKKHNTRCKRTYQRLKENILEKKKDNYHNKEGEKEKKRTYYERNKERILEQKKKDYYAKKDAIKKEKEKKREEEQKEEVKTEN